MTQCVLHANPIAIPHGFWYPSRGYDAMFITSGLVLNLGSKKGFVPFKDSLERALSLYLLLCFFSSSCRLPKPKVLIRSFSQEVSL